MKYEKPNVEFMEFDEESVIFTSLGQGGTSGEDGGNGEPEIDWDL